ncbi:MAG: sigma 54-dependent Fis family transcriptional regulator [Deltaproteobacteria bacterium]|nr:MAG: sigma 54-dependent Fis family transcriptional regulator [Deltaproteobacteria bacterium]
MQQSLPPDSQDTLLYRDDKPLPSARIAIDDLSLEIIAGPHKGMKLPLRRESVLIGRGHWCDLCLENDFHSSKQHAELSLSEEGVLVRDLSSRNGITVNQVRVREAYLDVNATLTVGQSKMVLHAKPHKQQLELCYYDRSRQLVGQSPAMRKLFAQMERLGPMDFPVLLSGETGVGKTCIARAIHLQSERHKKPFVVVNCGAISPSLVESLFFGYEKGAFTGANKTHRGYFEQADGGTLFLDEIGELPLELQPRLLDVLEQGKVQRLGSESTQDVDFRVLSATHRNLLHEARAKTFREDLFYRLAVVTLKVPPLRDRAEDIPLLIDWLAQDWKLEQNVSLTPQALSRLQQFPWPGNVRQLRNVLKRSVVLASFEHDQSEAIQLDAEDIHLPSVEETLSLETSPTPETSTPPQSMGQTQPVGSLKDLLESTEKQALLNALNKHDWNVAASARSLDITRAWLYKRIKKYGFEPPESV